MFIVFHSVLSSQPINGETFVLSLESIHHDLSHFLLIFWCVFFFFFFFFFCYNVSYIYIYIERERERERENFWGWAPSIGVCVGSTLQQGK